MPSYLIFNGPKPASFVYFQPFANIKTILHQINVRNDLGIRGMFSNSWPLGHVSPPLTIRPKLIFYLLMLFKIVFLLVNEVKIFYEKFVPFFNLPYRSIVVIVYLVAILYLRMVGTDGCTGQWLLLRKGMDVFDFFANK